MESENEMVDIQVKGTTSEPIDFCLMIPSDPYFSAAGKSNFGMASSEISGSGSSSRSSLEQAAFEKLVGIVEF